MKKWTPALCLLLCAVLAAAGVWALGGITIRRADVNPDVLRLGAMFSYLRDGQRFSLADAYPQEWDRAQFAASVNDLSRLEQRRLFAYDGRFASTAFNTPLMLLWQEGHVTSAFFLPDDQDGYPRFADALGGGSFEVAREEAEFLCTFVPHADGRGGYYDCRVEGEQA